jgi:hypothetical protein
MKAAVCSRLREQSRSIQVLFLLRAMITQSHDTALLTEV